jgi:hypothetical protein
MCTTRRAHEGEVRKLLLHGSTTSLPGPFLSLGPSFSSLRPGFISFIAGSLSLGPRIFSLGTGYWANSRNQTDHSDNGQYEYENSHCQSAGNNRPCVQTHLSASPCKSQDPSGVTVTL